MQEKNIGIGIVGGTGFGAAELMRLITFRDDCSLVTVVSSSKAGKSISEVHPQLQGINSQLFASEINFDVFDSFENKVLFMALPHGVSSSKIHSIFEEAKNRNCKIIDLSGDFRLSHSRQRLKHYPESEAFSATASSFVYGIPELYRDEISKSNFIANCGCFAITSILAAAPIAYSKKVERIVVDGKSGTSGAGKSLADIFHHPTAHANAFAYKVLTHRHEAEIAQGLGDPLSQNFELSFVPHVIPCSRGIYSTAHIFLEEEITQNDAYALFEEYYKESPFVRIRKSPPKLNSVIGSNYCDISITTRGKNIVCIAAIDNLIKGMCGTALQNMNLMCGISETKGLLFPSLGAI